MKTDLAPRRACRLPNGPRSRRLRVAPSLLPWALTFGRLGCAVVGCAGPPNGLTENGSFHYDCVGPGDRECDDREPFTPAGALPGAPLARGARFRLLYVGSSSPVLPVGDSAVAVADGVMTARRAGDVGLFVEAGEEIEDALRLRVLEADRIGIEPIGARLGALSVGVGGEVRLRVVAFRGPTALAGSLPVTWSVDDATVATLEQGAAGTSALRGIRPGRVRVRATFESLASEIAVEVEGASPSDGGALDAGSDG